MAIGTLKKKKELGITKIKYKMYQDLWRFAINTQYVFIINIIRYELICKRYYIKSNKLTIHLGNLLSHMYITKQ